MKNFIKLLLGELKARVPEMAVWMIIVLIDTCLVKFGVQKNVSSRLFFYSILCYNNIYIKTPGLATITNLPIKRNQIVLVNITRIVLQFFALIAGDALLNLWISPLHFYQFIERIPFALVVVFYFIIGYYLYREIIIKYKIEYNWLFKFFAIAAIMAPIVFVGLLMISSSFDVDLITNVVLSSVMIAYLAVGLRITSVFFSQRKEYLYLSGNPETDKTILESNKLFTLKKMNN